MGKKARLKAIKNLANRLPVIMNQTHEEHFVSGSEILSWGTIKEIDGKPIDPGKKYIFNYPVEIAQNNRRGMKRAYLKNGEAGISHFLKGIYSTVKENHVSNEH